MSERMFKQPSVMTAQKHFSMAPQADVPRSRFDRSHGHKTTYDAGYLVPVYVDEALPGDTFDVRVTQFARLATPSKPVMDNIYNDIHFFFVPNRLLWDHWENFMGERDDPADDPSVYTVPTITVGLNGAIVSPGGLLNYFGIPYRGLANTVTINSLPLRAYALIYTYGS